MSRCPSDRQLEEFLEERLNDSDQTFISRHVDYCEHCQAKLEELTAALEGGTGVRQAHVIMRALDPSTDFLLRLKQNPPSPSGLSGTGQRNRAGSANWGKPGEAPCGSKPPLVANYEIISELGRGGMGVVYKTRQIGLDRLVALKMVLAGPHAGPKELERFRQEAEAVARLRHPNIIQIYDIGESEGRPYLALEFVEGNSLAHLLMGAPQPLYASARLIETLAGAIHYAHQRNIVHRDLKPANILLQFSESQVPLDPPSDAGSSFSADGTRPIPLCNLDGAVPKITDFGLAKRLDERGMRTQSGDIIGTPSYMAPEQAGATGRTVGPATDVYALGAILYELLTGRPPFRGPTSLDTVLLVVHEDPVRPSYLRRDLPRDLETIVLKCLAKEPSKRYTSAEALAEDLHRFRKGKPIKARPVGLHEWVWKWARHRPVSASMVAGMFLTAVLAFVGITWQWQESRIARDEAESQRELAEEARKKARATLYCSLISQSQLQWRVNDFPSAKQSLANCLPAPGEDDLRGWEWHYLQSLFHNDLFTLFHSRGGQGGSVAFDPQGNRIASVVSGPPAGETTWPAEVRIWDARTGDLVHSMTGPSNLHRLVFSPDGKRIALATTDGEVLIWDPVSGREILRRKMHDLTVAALAFSPNGETVVSAGWDKTVKIWNATTGEVVHTLRGHESKIQSVAFHPTRPMVASASWDATVRIWDLTSPDKQPRILRGHKIAVYCVAFSPDGRSLVSAGGNGNLKIWNLETYQIVQSLTGDAGAVLSIAYSPDGRYLAKAGKDGTVRVWHLATGVERMSFRGHAAPVESVHFSPDCRRVVSISPGDGIAKVWDFTRHPEFAIFAKTDADVDGLMFSDDGKRLFSITRSGKVQVWDGLTGMLLEERVLPVDVLSPAVPVSFAPGGKFLAGRTRLNTHIVTVWDTANGAETATLRGHTLPVYCVRFSKDGRRLATAACSPQSPDALHEIKIWDASTGQVLKTLKGKGRVFNLAFNPAGNLLAWSGQDGAIGVIEWQAGFMGSSSDLAIKAIGHQGDVNSLVFSGDGRLLASAGMEDRTVKIWPTEQLLAGDFQALHTITGPRLIGDLAFSPDNKRLAAISRDMVKMWEVDGGYEVLTLRGAPQRYWDPTFNPRLAFSPDGIQLAGSNWDESISSWEALPLDSEEQFTKFQEKRRWFADQRTSFWHLQEAELCLLHNNLAAAQFHLRRLDNESLTEPLRIRSKNAKNRVSKLLDHKF